MKTRIPVEIYYDDESENWAFTVEDPKVVGGGCRTREEAMQSALEAVGYALGVEAEMAGADPGGREYLEVGVTPLAS